MKYSFSIGHKNSELASENSWKEKRNYPTDNLKKIIPKNSFGIDISTGAPFYLEASTD